MHWTFAKPANKGYCGQIEEPIDKTLYAELGGSVFSRAMLYHFFANFSKPGPLCNNRNIPVHFSINLYAFNYFSFVCLKPTIEIMKINPAGSARNTIKK